MSAPTNENVDDVVVVEDDATDADEGEKDDNARSLPHILTKYFEIVGTISEAGKADGKCLLCPNKTLSGTINATTNLSKHLVSHFINILRCKFQASSSYFRSAYTLKLSSNTKPKLQQTKAKESASTTQT